jgi:CBS domain-containing protein
MATHQKEAGAQVKDSKHATVDFQAITKLSAESFKMFCNDISGMFGVNMDCKKQPRFIGVESLEGLKKHFKEPVSIHCVKAEGAIEDIFYLVFDCGGLFTLAGVVNMHPEKTILREIKSGTLESAKNTSNVLAEVGQALVGSWDRVFRKELNGHKSFIQTNVFVGNPWDESDEIKGLSSKNLRVISYEMTVEPYPTFKCGVIFPQVISSGTSKPALELPFSTEEKTESQKSKSKNKTKKADLSKTNKVEQNSAEKITENHESKGGPISETIRKMVQADAVPSAQSELPPTAEKLEHNKTPAPSATCAKDIMQKEVHWGTGEDSVQLLSTKMQQHNISYIMIGQNGSLEGIISISDLKSATSPYLRPEFAKWHRPLDDATLQIKAKWIMSKPVHTIEQETPLTTIMENMCQFSVRCLPVVNQQSKVQGFVTVFDIFRALLKSEANTSPDSKQ